MKKVILGLMALSILSINTFASTTEKNGKDYANDGFISLEEMRKENYFNGLDTSKIGKHTFETNFGIWLNDRNNVDITIEQNFYNQDHKDSGFENDFYAEFEIYTQLSDDGRWELYTDFTPIQRTDLADSNGNSGYIDVYPTYFFMRNEKISSLIRAGLGYQYGADTENSMTYGAKFKNILTISDYLELEGNLYYNGVSKTGLDNFSFEAYFYMNYPLYEFENGIKFTGLFEGGFDPYSFYEREVEKIGMASGKEKEYVGNYVVYLQPTVRATFPVKDGQHDFYIETGYYALFTGGDDEIGNGSGPEGDGEDSLFLRLGFDARW
jgi:hypothetical protein